MNKGDRKAKGEMELFFLGDGKLAWRKRMSTCGN